MAEILARSPFILEINETGQEGSMVKLYLWNGTGSAPVSPTYTFTKLIPSLLLPTNYYNLSPYIREYINNLKNPNIYNTIEGAETQNYCNVKAQLYKLVGGVYTLLYTVEYYGWDGWGYHEDGGNPVRSEILLDQKDYYYYYKVGGDLTSEPNIRAGFLTIRNTNYDAVYTNLRTGATWSPPITGFGSDYYNYIYRVNPTWYADGNNLKIYDNSTSLLVAEFNFIPLQECRYEPYAIDFINKYGAWQREFFFKASYDSLDVKTNQYQLMHPSINNYKIEYGNFRDFNVNGKETIKLNTGFVKEDFKENLTQLMLSERILVNDKPVTLKTKSLDRTKEINNKMINYTIEFEMAYDTINNVV